MLAKRYGEKISVFQRSSYAFMVFKDTWKCAKNYIQSLGALKMAQMFGMVVKFKIIKAHPEQANVFIDLIRYEELQIDEVDYSSDNDFIDEIDELPEPEPTVSKEMESVEQASEKPEEKDQTAKALLEQAMREAEAQAKAEAARVNAEKAAREQAARERAEQAKADRDAARERAEQANREAEDAKRNADQAIEALTQSTTDTSGAVTIGVTGGSTVEGIMNGVRGWISEALSTIDDYVSGRDHQSVEEKAQGSFDTGRNEGLQAAAEVLANGGTVDEAMAAYDQANSGDYTIVYTNDAGRDTRLTTEATTTERGEEIRAEDRDAIVAAAEQAQQAQAAAEKAAEAQSNASSASTAYDETMSATESSEPTHEATGTGTSTVGGITVERTEYDDNTYDQTVTMADGSESYAGTDSSGGYGTGYVGEDGSESWSYTDSDGNTPTYDSSNPSDGSYTYDDWDSGADTDVVFNEYSDDEE